MAKSIDFPDVTVHYRTLRPESACAAASDTNELVPVALTSKSFGDAKLCYKDASKKAILLLAPSEKCPAGTIEQTAPVDDCASLERP